MEKFVEQAIREQIATLSQEQKDVQIFYECLGKKPRIELLKLYVELGLPFNYVSKTQDGVLHVLAKKKKPDIMKMFIDLGADINAKNSSDETPLHICTSKCDSKSMKYLIEAGANINAVDNKGRTPLIRACVLLKGVMPTNLLLNNNADILASEMNAKQLGGHCIVLANNPRLITKDLIDKGFFDYPDGHGVFPIHLAMLHGYRRCIEEFVHHGFDLNLQDERNGDTPLHTAIRCGRDELVTYLFEQDVDITIMNDDNETAIQLAERLQWPNVSTAIKVAQKEAEIRKIQKEFLINNGDNSMSDHNLNNANNRKRINKKKENPLSAEELAEKDMRHFSRIIELLKDKTVLPTSLKMEMREINDHNIVDEEGRTIMHHAAINGNSTFIMSLIRRNISAAVKDNINRTPLMYAILSGDEPSVNVLMNHGYDIHEVDEMNNSLFVLAYWMEMYEVALRLVHEGADDRNLLQGRVE